MQKTQLNEYDVIIVGAGLSGIGAAYHVQSQCPKLSYAVLEGRAAMGGTWDFFKYPGLRSDSDMYTLGFSFYPWKNAKAIADGKDILAYIKETAAHFSIDEHILYQHRVIDANWSTKDQLWTIEVAPHEEVPSTTLRCRFLFMCSGYYNYETGHNPAFLGSESFEGKIIHPQQWDTGYDYTDKRVVVVGSGATAVTLVPELAKKAKHVTMLQRSPGYSLNLPSKDKVANSLKTFLPAKVAHFLARWKNILFSMWFYNTSRKRPEGVRAYIAKQTKATLGEHYEREHFDPKYNPWDQRVCFVPDNDLFEAIKSDKVDLVTDTINRFTPKGIMLPSGKVLEADLIVTATGLKIQLFGGMQLKIDGNPVDMGEQHAYRGVMLSGIPNFAVAVGYTNASWTLKCDLNAQYVARILKRMQRKNLKVVTPQFDPDSFTTEPLLDFDAGYITRAQKILPK
ncbi:MAG: NAD(P)/FAD-dependent oxidoreductase, partial [Bacteroidota bacterium]